MIKENANFKDFFREGQASGGDSPPNTRTIRLREEKFQIFLAIALALLCLEPLIAERKKKSPGRNSLGTEHQTAGMG